MGRQRQIGKQRRIIKQCTQVKVAPDLDARLKCSSPLIPYDGGGHVVRYVLAQRLPDALALFQALFIGTAHDIKRVIIRSDNGHCVDFSSAMGRFKIYGGATYLLYMVLQDEFSTAKSVVEEMVLYARMSGRTLEGLIAFLMEDRLECQVE